MIAICGAAIHGGGNIPRNHDFRIGFAFSLQLAVQRLVRVAVEAKIPVKSVLGHHDFDYKGFDDGYGHILTFIPVDVLFQCVLENGKLFRVVHNFLGGSFCGQFFDFFLELLHLRFQFGALHAESPPTEISFRTHFNVAVQLLGKTGQLCLLGF